MLCATCNAALAGEAETCAECGEPAIAAYHPTLPLTAVRSTSQAATASRGKRFINLLIDAAVVGIGTNILIALGLDFLFGGNLWFVSWSVILFGYYFATEMLWSKTPGKFLTKTRVVTDTGEKPTAQQLAIRTICRLIPFEAFSLLGHPQPIGWHDQFSHTKVIDERPVV